MFADAESLQRDLPGSSNEESVKNSRIDSNDNNFSNDNNNSDSANCINEAESPSDRGIAPPTGRSLLRQSLVFKQ
jgi:hypothetical protein